MTHAASDTRRHAYRLVGIQPIVRNALTLHVFGILSIVAGITLLFSPLWGALVLFIFAAVSLIVLGIMQIVRALTFGRGATAAV